MRNPFKSSSESKPCLQEAGGGMVLDQTKQVSKISEDENMASITTKKSHEFEHQRFRNMKIEPSPKPVSSSYDGDGTFIWEEDQKQEDTADGQEKNEELHEIPSNFTQINYVSNFDEKIKSFIDHWTKLINNPDKSKIFKKIMHKFQIVRENKNLIPKCISLYPEKTLKIVFFMIQFLKKYLSLIQKIAVLRPQGANYGGIAQFFDKLLKILSNHHSNMTEDKEINQYARYICLMKDGTLKNSEKFYPQNEDKNKVIHSEEFLLDELNEFLIHNGNMVIVIVIYSSNSPCLKRLDEITPCMFEIFRNAGEWYKKYHITTHVAFTKIYGMCGPKYFQHFTFNKISSPDSVFNSYIEKCENVPFQLKHLLKDTYIKRSLETLLSDEKIDKNTLEQDIKTAQSILKTRANSSCDLRKNLLLRGEETIPVSFKSPPEVQVKLHDKLRELWNEMVNNNFMIPIRECMRTDLNNAVIPVFKNELELLLGNSSFFHLHQIPHSVIDQFFFYLINLCN
ncbi:uncharacterized protein LOC115787178 [Archocentrus centrarchus]|uniref:uncharacterized protein LOC115787178 n=1 Tax=Archocentrus centrarchus TaxID=63155 RepID=UPI0011EA297D|nr:uncharacterized protein LOC115787178 [Archocentrus centrarchus]